MFCHLPDSGRHLTSVSQGLSLSRSKGREGEDPGNEVVHVIKQLGSLLSTGESITSWTLALL